MSGGPALRALESAVAELLESRGATEALELWREGELAFFPPSETWKVSSREVSAHRFALSLPVPAFARLRTHAGLVDLMRAALSDAVRSPNTALADLSVVLMLPVVMAPWHDCYRSVGPASPERDDPERVLSGAAELAEALSDETASGLLRAGTLERADLPKGRGGAQEFASRLYLHLPAKELAVVLSDAALADRLRLLLVHAGSRAQRRVAGVEIRLLGS